jgi:hypothetical protein
MNIEQIHERALRAAQTDDVAGIQQALDARAQAIRELVKQPPSKELAGRMAAAIEAGNEIRRALLAIKYRAGSGNARLAQWKTGVAAGLGSGRKWEVDCRG